MEEGGALGGGGLPGTGMVAREYGYAPMVSVVTVVTTIVPPGSTCTRYIPGAERVIEGILVVRASGQHHIGVLMQVGDSYLKSVSKRCSKSRATVPC